MKAITTILCLFFLYANYAQNSQELDDDYDYKMEMEKFTDNVTFYNDHLLRCYDDFNDLLAIESLRVMKSEHSYPSIIPMEINLINTLIGYVPGGKQVSGVTEVFTGLLEKGWKAHNEEIETKRKTDLINGQIMSYVKNLSDKTAFSERMGPFLKRGSLPSDFEVKMQTKYYQGDVYEQQQIFEDLFEINEALEKYPIFSSRGDAATSSMKRLFYEDYIRQFASIHRATNSLNGTSGSLVGYLEFDDDFNLVHKLLVPDVPAGYEIGVGLNRILPKLKVKPLDLKVIKVLLINSPYHQPAEPKIKRRIWSITLTEIDNTIARLKLTKMIANEPYINLQPGTENKHAQRFLKEFGFKDKESGLWRIKRSLFNEFTELIPKKAKNVPDHLREMIEF